MPLRVTKSDGSVEVYLHTKVMGTIAAALGESGLFQEGMTEHLAEAVTEYIARRYGSTSVVTDEIHAMIEAVLSETGYYEAALALHEHRLTRHIKRNRIEVVHFEVHNEGIGWDARIGRGEDVYHTRPWNKSIIVNYMETERGQSHALARAVAGAVEEKVLRMGGRRVFARVIKNLVDNELWNMKEAENFFSESQEDILAEDAAVDFPAGKVLSPRAVKVGT